MTEDRDSAAPPQRLKILMTEGSSLSSRQALYALGPRHTIDILDPSALCQCRFSRFVRRWYRAPSFAADPLGYLKFLAERLKNGMYDVLFPLHEEVYLLSRVRDELARRVAVVLPAFESVERLFSKLNFLALLKELELPHPEAAIVADRAELDRWSDFPRFVKLDAGTAGQGVQLVRDRAELQSALRNFEQRGIWRDGNPLILQRQAAGQQSVVHAVFRQAELVEVAMDEMRVRGVGGSAVARQSCFHPLVVDHLRRLGTHLNWHGPLFLDFFVDPATGTPSYIEANPRIGDTANATGSGRNLCRQWMEIAMGTQNSPDRSAPQPPLSTRSPFRSHQGFLILISRALEGARRRGVVGEFGRQLAGTGVYENSFDEMTRPREDWLSVLPYAWIAGQLLASPARAAAIIRGTVDHYSLGADAARRIRELPLAELIASLGPANTINGK
jgi:hypothetical protein